MRARAVIWVGLGLVAAAACAADQSQNQNQNQSQNQNPSQSQSPIPNLRPRPANGAFWEGESDGWRWSWTAGDVTAVKEAEGQRRSFSLAAMLRPVFDHDMAELRAGSEGKAAASAAQCTRETDVAVLSIVGSLLSYRETRNTSCAGQAHPDGETIYATINVAVAGERSRVVLDALFPQAAIATALRADKVVQNSLGSAKVGTGLADLVQALADAPPVVSDAACYAFPKDVLARFAFHHVSDGRVAVRIGVPGAGTCLTQLTQLGIMLPVTQPLAGPLQLAANQSGGLLMQQAEQIAGTTHWTWRSGS